MSTPAAPTAPSALQQRLSEVLIGLSPKQIIPTLTVVLVSAALNVFVDVSFAALIFSDELSGFVAAGIGLIMVSGIIYFTVITLIGSVPGVIAAAQNGALYAVLAAAIVSQMRATATPEEMFLTTVGAIILTTALTGLVFLILGRFKLGKLGRYVPYPVIGGFLAGVGWLLLIGSLDVMTGAPVTLETFPALFLPETLLHWLPGVLFAVTIFLITRRFDHYLIMPAALLLATAVFYGVVLIGGMPIPDVIGEGWMLGPFPDGALWRPLLGEVIAQADWRVVIGQIGNTASIIFVAVVTLLMYTGGIELELKRDLDLNHELQVLGLTNIAAALAGGITGFHEVATTSLSHRLKAANRLIGLLLAALYVVLLLIGPTALSYIPRVVIGGLLLLIGLGLLYDWLWKGFRTLARTDYFVVLLITVVIAAFGFLPGFAVGIVASVVLFVVNYSRINVVKHALTAQARRSNTDRSPSQREILRERGHQVAILELQGFIFFGTGEGLLDQVRQHARLAEQVRDLAKSGAESDRARLRFAILDFRLVSGVDSSVVMSFSKMRQLAEQMGFTLVFTSMSDALRGQFVKQSFDLADGKHFRSFADLDHGLEFCENQLIFDARATMTISHDTLERQLTKSFPEAVEPKRLMKYLQRHEFKQGDVLFRQGDPADALYFVESGLMTAYLDLPDGRRLRLRTVGAGATIGEMALYTTQATRSAAVACDQGGVVYALPLAELQKMEKKDPEVAAAFHRFIARLLADRLVENNNLVEALIQ